MIIYEGIGGLVLFLAMAVTAIYMYGRMCRDAGYEEGRADQYTAIGELAEMAELADHPAEHAEPRPGRHARTQPRALAAVPTFTPAGPQQRPPWYREIPGPDHPQPGRDSGAGTVTMDRIQLDTGEFRAASEEDIKQRSADNAAWLEKWSAGATA